MRSRFFLLGVERKGDGSRRDNIVEPGLRVLPDRCFVAVRIGSRNLGPQVSSFELAPGQ